MIWNNIHVETGIPENSNDNTNQLVLNVVTNLVLKENEEKITIKDIPDNIE